MAVVMGTLAVAESRCRLPFANFEKMVTVVMGLAAAELRDIWAEASLDGVEVQVYRGGILLAKSMDGPGKALSVLNTLAQRLPPGWECEPPRITATQVDIRLPTNAIDLAKVRVVVEKNGAKRIVIYGGAVSWADPEDATLSFMVRQTGLLRISRTGADRIAGRADFVRAMEQLLSW